MSLHVTDAKKVTCRMDESSSSSSRQPVVRDYQAIELLERSSRSRDFEGGGRVEGVGDVSRGIGSFQTSEVSSAQSGEHSP